MRLSTLSSSSWQKWILLIVLLETVALWLSPVSALPEAKFAAGDIIAKTASSTDQMLYVITEYDAKSDMYTRAWIYKNADGSWGHFSDNKTEKAERTLVEKIYPVKIARVTVSSIPIVTPTIPPTAVTTLSGSAPTVTGISPASGAKDATVGVTITGTNFETGATAKLMRAGYPPITGTGVSVSSATSIGCTFNLASDLGSYNVVVTNLGGQSDTLIGAFSITAGGTSDQSAYVQPVAVITIPQTPVTIVQPMSDPSGLIILLIIGVVVIGGGYIGYTKMKRPARRELVLPSTPKPITTKQFPPDLSDHYTEPEFIGKGGFARVFKAKRKDGKFVAVKIPISMDAVTGKSFIAEMQNWTKLSHPNIVRLFDFNIMPMPYFEEELCDSALSEQAKPIESEEAAWILFNICEGLKFAHDRKIIHRDLKPQNILLKNGVPKISDWGLSRIISESTTTSTTSFTPYYAAPEQINNRAKDERTDIWQLGVILYELVTGVLPFRGDSMVEIGMNIATKDPIRPSETIPDAKVIDAVVMKCLQKDPAKRYQSVLELQKDLALYLRDNYTELLKTSVSVQDYTRSAYYCCDLVMINMLTGDLATSYKYLLDLVHYSKGDVKVDAQELSEQIKMRMEMGVTEIPDELIQKAEIIVHQVSLGFRNKGCIH